MHHPGAVGAVRSQSVSARRSAIATVVRFVFARGIVGMIEASATITPVEPEHAPARVHDAADPAGPCRVEVVADAPPDVGRERLLPGSRLGPEQMAERRLACERPGELEPFDDHRQVCGVAQHAAFDVGQRLWIARAEPDAADRPGLHVEHGDARLVRARCGSLVHPGEQVEVPAAWCAAAARRLDQRVRPEQRPGAPDVLGRRSREQLRSAPIGDPCRDGRAAARRRAGLPRSGCRVAPAPARAPRRSASGSSG